jgi:hypothetical protein
MLANKGCGQQFLRALGLSLKCTNNILGKETFQSSSGVKQGSPTSCGLFTFYINSTSEALRLLGDDGFLQSNHSLLLMDDTVVLATSRHAMEVKLQTLVNSANAINMALHPTKSQFMTVSTTDDQPIVIGSITISKTEEYVYLGTPILDSTISAQVERHVKKTNSNVHKFTSFINKNADAPFRIKRLVWHSAMTSAILYGCESWLTNSLKCVSQPFLATLKILLGVRFQTCTDLVKLELGIGDAKSLIKNRQASFFNKLASRTDYHDSPLHFAIELAKTNNSPMGLYIRNLSTDLDHTKQELRHVYSNVQQATTSRRSTYMAINPQGLHHSMYYTDCVPEYARISFSRIRLGSHRLRVETGRWSRMAWDERVCPCDGISVQTEEHLLCQCPSTDELREQYNRLNFASVENLMNCDMSLNKDLALFVIAA